MQLLKDTLYLLASFPFLALGFVYGFMLDMFVRGWRAYEMFIGE